MGPHSQKGFGIFANVLIRKGEEIPELIGLMPQDNRAPHSELSAVTVAAHQDQPEGEERVLIGPIRMVNHLCQNFNAEVRGFSY
jgi:hypothetical protein